MTYEEMLVRAKRAALFCELVGTIADGAERADFVRRLRKAGVISSTAADLLDEVYHFGEASI